MSISQPTTNGPSQPERLPIELISAMPPAAAVPASIVVGICQNGENALSTPETPRTSAANASTGVCRELPDQHQPDRGGQARQRAVISPLEPPVGTSADQHQRDHRGDVRHRREQADRRVARHAHAADDRRAPEAERRVGADQAEVDQRQQPHARIPERVAEPVRAMSGAPSVGLEIGEDERLLAGR